MTTLLWDQVGRRLYETGLDRGVLYLSDNSGVAWNGLTAIDEDTGDDSVDAVYFDGVKYLDEQKFGDFAATLKALTYPDEFLEYEGVESIGNGVYVDGQNAKMFGLAYRTLVGNDLEGSDFGYKIHLLYNLTVSQDATTFETLSNQLAPTDFSWSITSVPVVVDGYRPTAHVILDSRYLPADVLAAIESILYGIDGTGGLAIYDGGTSADSGDTEIYDGGSPTDGGDEEIDGGGPGDVGDELPGSDFSGTIDGGESESVEDELPGGGLVDTAPRLPPISELIDLVTLWGPKIIVPNTTTGLAALTPGSGDITQTNVAGVYVSLPGNRLVETSTPGIYVLS